MGVEVEVETRTGPDNKHMDVTGLAVHVGICMRFHRFSTERLVFLRLVCTERVVFPSQVTKEGMDSTNIA